MSQPLRPLGHTPRGRWVVVISAVVAAAVLALTTGTAFVVGRLTAEPRVRTVEVAGKAPAQPFTDADVAWCREYNIVTTRVVEESKAAGLPTNVAGRAMPASAWTADEKAANRRLVEYLGKWDTDLFDLRSRVAHPVLELLLKSMGEADRKLATVLSNETYTPGDYDHFRDGSTASGALGEACERLQP